MFNNRPIALAVLYSILVILFKLIIILGGFAISNFGFNWAQIIPVFLIIPFIGFTIKSVRTQNGGYIGGKQAVKKGLQMAIVGIVIVSIYNYIEFEWKWKDISELYYRSDIYLHYLQKRTEIKPEQYQEIINAQVQGFRDSSPFQYVTVKMVPYLFFSVSTSFMFAVFLKKQPPFSLN